MKSIATLSFVLVAASAPVSRADSPPVNVTDGADPHLSEAVVRLAAPAARVYAALTDYEKWPGLFSDVKSARIRDRTPTSTVVALESRLVGHAHEFTFRVVPDERVRFEQSDGAHGSRLWTEIVLERASAPNVTVVRARLYSDVVGAWGLVVTKAKLRLGRHQKLRSDLSDLVARFGATP